MASESVRLPESIRIADDFQLDLRAYELRRSGRVVKLERIPMELLLVLVEHRGKVVSREEIVERVWGKDVYLDADNSINAAIRKIRVAFRDDPDRPRYLQTITGKGYRFIAPVTEESAPEPVVEIAAQPSSPETWLGKKISHYRVLQLLGGGGMGVVYKGEDLSLGRRVALKFLPAELARDPEALQRLKREARAASSLDHPNICSVYGLEEHQGQPFIVMQLLEGQTLREWIQNAANRKPSERVREALELLAQVCAGLQAAHEKGIVHGDIKPANIFVSQNGQVKILDFGVAKLVEDGAERSCEGDRLAGSSNGHTQPELASSEPTRTEAGAGTPSYLSPEQVRHEALDARTDLFSLGLVLHEMITGRRTFSGDTATAVRNAVLHEPAVSIRESASDLPPRLEKIVEKALEKDRTKRYQSAVELRSDIEKVRQASLRIVPLWKRAWVQAMGLLALLGIAIAIGVLLPRMRHRVAPEPATAVKARRSAAVLGFQNLSGRADQDWISTALSEMLATELASSGELRVIPGENVARMKRDLPLRSAGSYSSETLTRIRRNLGTDVVILGSYLDSPESHNVRLDLRVQDAASGELIVAASETGSENDLAEMVSRAGAALRAHLGVAPAPATEYAQMRSAMPANTEAAKLYAQGLAKLRLLDASGARPILEQAVAADANHALSHSALAQALAMLGYDAKAQAEAKRALDLSGALSRQEQLLIEGRYRQLTHDWPGAIETYRTLWNFFPDDLEYGLLLAGAQAHSAPKEALETVARMRKLPAPLSQDVRIDIAEADALEGLSDFARTRQVSEAAALKAEAQDSRLLIARALNQEGYACDRLGDRQAAIAAFSRARDLRRAAGDARGAAANISSIGIVQYNAGELEAARALYEESLAEFRRIGALANIASGENNLGILLQDEGKLQEAKAAFEEALRIQRELEDKRGVASDLDDIGNVQLAMGDLDAAARSKKEALEAFHAIGNKMGEAITMNNFGEVMMAKGDLAQADDYFQRSLALKREIRFKQGIASSQFNVSEVLLRRGQLQQALANSQEVLRMRSELGNEVQVAKVKTQIAQIYVADQHPDRAEGLAREAESVFAKRKIADSDALSLAVLSETLLAAARKKEARDAADRALLLAHQGGDIRARLEVMLADADVKAASSATREALNTLEALRAETHRRGFAGYELEANLRLGKLALTSGRPVEGRTRLLEVEKEADTRGFGLIAQEAKSLLASAPTR